MYKVGTAVQACDPRVYGVETGRIPGACWTGSKAKLVNSQLMRNSVSMNGGEQQKYTLNVDLWPPHACKPHMNEFEISGVCGS